MAKAKRGATPKAPIDTDTLRAAGGSTSAEFGNQVIGQTIQSIYPGSSSVGAAEKHDIFLGIKTLACIRPEDEIEAMLVAQMIGSHNAAMECLRRAALQQQTFEGRDVNLKHAAKLQSIYARQLEVLDKRRGKGHQQVTVKHVHVESGGQAIVGNVGTPNDETKGGRRKKLQPDAIANEPGDIMDLHVSEKIPTRKRIS